MGADDENPVHNTLENMYFCGSLVAIFNDVNMELHGQMHDVGVAVEAVV